MRKLIFAVMAFVVMTVSALEPKDVKIFIDPGHMGHTSDDRNVVIPPYKQGDHNGFWESQSNLDKGLFLRDLLQKRGFQVAICRTTNDFEGVDDDPGLSTRARMSNEFGADMFLSIHSNATGTAVRRNFPLMLFRGYDNEPKYPGSEVFALEVNRQLLDNQATYWTSTNTNVRGDWSFYPSWGTQGLGVLRPLTSKGMLSEGSFHDYIPETYRLMNMDYKWLEAWHFFKAIESYFGIPSVETTGVIAGLVYDERAMRNVGYARFGHDALLPMNKTLVQLFDKSSNALVKEYTTDNMENGFYLFKDVAPGVYILKTTPADHYPAEVEVVVEAGKASYAKIAVKLVRSTPPSVVEYSPVWNEGDNPVACNSKIDIQFNWDMDVKSTEAAFSITPAVEGIFEWTDANYHLTFTPSSAMATNTLYTVKIAKAAQHNGGTEMSEDFQFKFLTDSRNNMQLLSVWPYEGAEVDANDAWGMINVDSPLSMDGINMKLKMTDSEGKQVSWNVRKRKAGAYNDPYGWVRLPVSAGLTPGATYKFTVADDVADKNGIKIESGKSVTFTARDFSKPITDGVLVLSFDDASQFGANDLNTQNGTVQLSSVSTRLEGASALKATYKFMSEQSSAVCFNVPEVESVFTSSDVMGINIYGDLSNNMISAVFDFEGQVFKVPVTEIKFYGWQEVKVDLATLLEDGRNYKLTGFEIEQLNSKQGMKGVVYFDQLRLYAGQSGVGKVEFDGVKVYPNPASEYVIAGADSLIEKTELYTVSGVLVACASGNILNVSEVAAGNYIVKVYVDNCVSTHKIVITH